MAVRIKVKSLTEDNKTDIFEKLRDISKKGAFNGGEGKEIVLINGYTTNDSGSQVYIPLSFCKTLLGKSNDKLDHASALTEFNGNLLKRQESIVEQALEHLNNERTAVLNLRPGFGKTIMSIYISSIYKLLTLVIVHDSTLLNNGMI
ncbi:unnamed protein product, partial [marine sediment metagenome]